MVEYCAAQGRRGFVALLPDDPYGQVVEGALQSALPRVGGRLVAIERYPLDRVRLVEPVQRVIPALAQADVLYIPDGADGAALVVQALAGSRGAMQRLKLVGTGRWNDQRLFTNPAFAGAWFPGPDTGGFRAFSGRFRQRFNVEPERTASLAYDSTLLAAALSARGGQAQGGRFGPQTLNNPNGFAGVDGLFRFLGNGLNQRGLAVLEMRGGQPVPIAAAPTTFTAAS
jgi:branched-chain amino acid transport system substrate-binding protein